MFRWLIGASLQFRFLVLAAAAALVLFGSARLARMPVDVFPEFAPPIVEVQTEANGLSAEEVQDLITLNLEELLSGVPWLASIRSQSVTGLSSIILTFERGTNLMKARQMIQERLTLAYTLPNVATPPVILQPLSATSRFMMIGLSSDTIEPTELSLLARWTVKPRLLGVPGVANVAIWGQRLRQLHVHIDPQRLRDAKVMQDDIIAAAGDALWVSPLTFLKGSAPGTGGWIDNANQRLTVQHTMPIETPEDMAKVAVAPAHLLLSGKSMSLGDVTEVTFAHPPLIGDAVGRMPNTLMLVIEKFPSANTLEVTRNVDQALAELRRGLPGVAIDDQVFRLSGYVEDSMSNLVRALIAAAGLALVVIGALLHHWRTTLVCLIAIPLSLLAALLALHLMGATINTMIVAGLVVALAVVIDDAVVDADTLLERLRHRGDDQTPVLTLLYECTLDSRRAALYASLIVVLAALPIFFMGGVAGAFFEPLGWAYVLAVLASMLVALTVTPAASALLLGRPTRLPAAPVLATRSADRYEALLRRVLAAPRKTFMVTGAALALGAALVPLLGQSLLPPLAERDLLVNWSTPPGTSHAETHRITSRVSAELRALPGVRSVGAHVGRAVTGDQVVGINASQIWLSLDPQADRDKVMAAVRETIGGYPGVSANVQTYLRDKVSEVLTGESKAIVVRIYGQKKEALAEKAEEVRRTLASIRGIVDLQATDQAMEPQLRVKVDLDAAERAHVKPGDVRRASSTVFSGIVVGYLFKEQKIYEVVVWGAPEVRQSISNLRDMWVEKSDRTHVRLGDVAQVGMVATPTVIRHERIAPYVDVVANVSGRDTGSVVDEIEDRLDKIAFPLEVHPEVLGEYAEREKAQRHMAGAIATAVIGIFLLLQAFFGSWRLAVIAFVALPVAAAGGVLGAVAGGAVVSLGSLVGFLAVLGIAARNGIVLIDRYRQLEAQGRLPFGAELVAQGTRERLAPIAVSAAAILAVLLPFVVLGGAPGLEILRPMALVIIGGLIAATLITLLVIPALYLRFGRTGETAALAAA